MSENLRTKKLVLGKVFSLIGETSWLLLCFIVAALVFAVLVRQFHSLELFVGTTIGQLLGSVMIYATACALVITPLWWRRGASAIRTTLGLTRLASWKQLGLAVPVWVLYMLTTIIAGVAVKLLLPWIDTHQAQDIGFQGIDTPIGYVIVFFALVVLPPIAEELMFRGYLFGRLRQRLGFISSALVVSALFGLVHGQWNVAIDTFILSMFLCYLRERTGTIWTGMVLHGLKNAVAYFLLFIAPLLGFNLLQ